MKTEGSATRSAARSMRRRLSTLPPIQFLKRVSPRLRRRKPKIGFDQPPQEIKRLALPTRPAPPTWMQRTAARTNDRIVRPVTSLVTKTGRNTIDFSRSAFRGGVEFGVRTGRRMVERWRRSPARAWCAARVNRAGGFIEPFVARVVGRVRPRNWRSIESVALMARTQHARSFLAVTVVCEWTAFAGLISLLGLLTATGRSWQVGAVDACGAILCGLALAGLALHAWCGNLMSAWRGLEVYICEQCGSLRNFSPALACPMCGTTQMPVLPGKVPARWARHELLLQPLSISGPALGAGMLVFAVRLFA